MTDDEWNAFCTFRENFKNQVAIWSKNTDFLSPLQKSAADFYKTPEYPLETPVVYNKALDDVQKNDSINLIVIGDNPGKDEQLLKNNRYLVGQAGKIAEGYFKKHAELGIDFRKNAIILNKTPVHSAKTNHLKKIARDGGEKTSNLIQQSQVYMAQKTAELHCKLFEACRKAETRLPELWLVGYSELGAKGIFQKYQQELTAFYARPENKEAYNSVYIFQHFSMNRFSIDLAQFHNQEENKNLSLIEAIHKLGEKHKNEIFGNITN